MFVKAYKATLGVIAAGATLIVPLGVTGYFMSRREIEREKQSQPFHRDYSN